MGDAPPRNLFSIRRIGITLAGALLGTLMGLAVEAILFPGPHFKGSHTTEEIYAGTAICIGCMLTGVAAGAVVAHIGGPKPTAS